jgi:hypothetical protein
MGKKTLNEIPHNYNQKGLSGLKRKNILLSRRWGFGRSQDMVLAGVAIKSPLIFFEEHRDQNFFLIILLFVLTLYSFVQMATHGPNLISILVILPIFVKGVSKH